MDYRETLEYISSVNWKGSVPGLDRISVLMEKLGNPQDKLKFVHIGGTNGKGSTAAFISHILRAAGYRTGLFISPYIQEFNERIQIDNQNISNEDLAEIATYIRPYAESMDDLPTEFELNTAIAFEYFYRKKCDIVVLEVGMGGEFDATNVIKKPEAAVLTAIGLDHMEYLGDTVVKIASTKAGIIKPGCQVVLYRQSDEVTDVIRQRCNEVNARLHISEPDKLQLINSDINGQTYDSEHGMLNIKLAAQYQKYNLATAVRTIEVLIENGFEISDQDIQNGLRESFWPGRFEILNTDPVFLVDGAHNPHGMKAAAESLRAVFSDKKLIVIFGVLKDKDYEQMLDIISPLVKVMLCVTPENKRALDASSLAEEVRSRGVEAKVFRSISDAVDAAFSMADSSDVICAIGSLYMIGDIKTYTGSFMKRGKKMKISENTCREFVHVLASKEPVPGGGGAAALCGAIGTALGNMVGSLTTGKKKYADVEDEIRNLMGKCQMIRERLVELIDEDAACFEPLANAYRLPAVTDEEKAHKAAVLEQCSKDACMVPLAIMEKCCEAIDITERMAAIGSRLAVSDAGCSAAILEGALKAASLNIFINTKGLTDRAFANSINVRADKMIEEYGGKAAEIFDMVAGLLK